MTLKVGETDPIVTVNLGVNIAKLNKVQIHFLLKENQSGKLESIRLNKEIDHLKEMLKQESQKLLMQGEISQPQTKASKLREENNQLQAQLRKAKSETMPVLIQKRFTNLMTWMDKYWDIYNKN